MRLRSAATVLALTLPSLAGCGVPNVPRSEVPPAELIAFAGHGAVFDREMKEIELTPALMERIQHAILAEAERALTVRQGADTSKSLSQARELLRAGQLSADEAVLLRSGVIARLLDRTPEEFRIRFDWRNAALRRQLLIRDPRLLERVRPEILRLLAELLARLSAPGREYARYCRSQGVPVPPDWAETGTAWQFQGQLTQNLLLPGAYAGVWTYSDPHQRGACVALPRGGGEEGSVAGIICQSATTGNACFWDNIDHDDELERPLGWRGRTLVIDNLRNGTNLSQVCTGCHTGNNVYLISPDDPTWARLLRGPMNGPRTGTFTTRVEASSDNGRGHPRYVPVTGATPRPGWVNTFRGTCGSCHETPSISTRPPMPPACAGTTAGCYGTP